MKINRILTCLIVNLSSTFAFANFEFETTCEIKNGRAIGGVNNFGEAFEINGDVTFHFFDGEKKYIDSDKSYEFEYVSHQSWEEIDSIFVPSNAVSCKFNISKAIKFESEENDRYSTTCEMKGNRAVGGVNNLGDAFEISGYVEFRFFDENNRLVDSDKTYTYEYVSHQSWEEIETDFTVSDAVSCKFDISKAVTVKN